MHPIVHDEVEGELIKKAVIRTKGGSRSSGLNADVWRRIIVLPCFRTATSDPHKAFAELVKKLCITNISINSDCSSLENFMACRLVLFNKNPG